MNYLFGAAAGEVDVLDCGHLPGAQVRAQVDGAARARAQPLAQLEHRLERLRVAHTEHLGPRLFGWLGTGT